MNDISEIVYHSSQFACGGLWSGTDGRYHEHYIAIIPESRYVAMQDHEYVLPQDKLPAKKPERPEYTYDKQERPQKPKAVWTKPEVKEYKFDGIPRFDLMHEEMNRLGIIDSVKRGLMETPMNFASRVVSWVYSNEYKNYHYDPPTMNGIRVSKEFIEAAMKEQRADSKRLQYFFAKEFS